MLLIIAIGAFVVGAAHTQNQIPVSNTPGADEEKKNATPSLISDQATKSLSIALLTNPDGDWGIEVTFTPQEQSDPIRIILDYHGMTEDGHYLNPPGFFTVAMPRFWKQDGQAVFKAVGAKNFFAKPLSYIVVDKICIVDQGKYHSYSGHGVADILSIDDSVRYNDTIESVSDVNKDIFTTPPPEIPQDHLADPRGYR